MEHSLRGLLLALAIKVRWVRYPVPIMARGVSCKMPNGGLGQVGGGIELLFFGHCSSSTFDQNQSAGGRKPDFR